MAAAKTIITSDIDPLTNLPNKTAWEHFLSQHASTRNPLVIFFFDIDGFKAINTRHGPRIGDLSLIAVAEIICSCLRPDDFIARCGEDDFWVLLDTSVNHPESMVGVIRDRILNRVYEYNSEHQIPIQLFIGGAFSPAPPHNLTALQKQAIENRRSTNVAVL